MQQGIPLLFSFITMLLSIITRAPWRAITIGLFTLGVLFTPLLAVQAAPGDAAKGNFGLNAVGENLKGDLPFAGEDPSTAGSKLPQIIGQIFRTLLSILGLIFLILIVYGGMRWMLARGDSAEVNMAKEILIHAFIGLIIVIAAFSIVSFVFDKVVVQTTEVPAP